MGPGFPEYSRSSPNSNHNHILIPLNGVRSLKALTGRERFRQPSLKRFLNLGNRNFEAIFHPEGGKMYTQFFSIFETSRDRALRISKNIWIWYYPKSAMRAQREELQNASASVRRTGARKKWANKKIGLHYAPQFS